MNGRFMGLDFYVGQQFSQLYHGGVYGYQGSKLFFFGVNGDVFFNVAHFY